MKTRKRASFVRIMAIVLSVLMIGSAFATVIPFLVNAEEADTLNYPITGYNPGNAIYEPIPMLVIMINFDADGDGVDDNANGTYETSSAVKDKNSSVYGEQWCHTTEEDWVPRLFSDEGNTLNSYYKYMSNDKFYWVPAKETYGTKDNGVISVTINTKHPQLMSEDGNWVHCFKQIVEAASEFVDFAPYDKNGNGKIDKYELCLAFIIGGAETSSGSTTMKEVFGFHAYYKDYDPYNFLVTDGVEVGYSGFFGTGAISSNNPLSFGVFAHELGHYLGAPDMYDYDGNKYDNAVGGFSMMASGSHGNTPSHFDPYMLSEYGFYTPTTVLKDGEYTLYSKASSKGDYNILKLATPNPGEYYLIENRYSSLPESVAFDKGVGKGILIWHIDENICAKTGMKVNNYGSGYDPGVVVYGPRNSESSVGNVLSTPGAFVSDHPTYKNHAVFEASAYNFPVSKTWYTSMTAEEAAKLENLKVTVVSGKGDEMTVKIEGVYDPQLEPEWFVRDSNVTKDSMTITGTLNTLNYCTLNSVKCEFIDAATKKVVKTDNVVLDKNYQFEINYTGLTPNTNYIVQITSGVVKANASAESSSVYTNDAFYTVPDVVKTKATVTIFANSDKINKTTSKTSVGECVKITDVMTTKRGYKFEGWYLDEALTTPFDVTKPLESTDDFSIYAKWAKDDSTTTGKVTTSTTAAPDSTTEPPAASGGCGSAIASYAIVTTSVIGLGFGFIRRKKEQ